MNKLDPAYALPVFLPNEEEQTKYAETLLQEALKNRNTSYLPHINSLADLRKISFNFLYVKRESFITWLGDACEKMDIQTIEKLIPIVSLDSYDKHQRVNGWELFWQSLTHENIPDKLNLLRNLILGGIATNPDLALNCVLAFGDLIKSNALYEVCKSSSYFGSKKIFVKIFPSPKEVQQLIKPLFKYVIKEALDLDKQDMWNSYRARIALYILCNCLIDHETAFCSEFMTAFDEIAPSMNCSACNYPARLGILRFASYMPCETTVKYCISLFNQDTYLMKDLFKIFLNVCEEGPNVEFVKVYAEHIGFYPGDLTTNVVTILRNCAVPNL